MRLQAVVTNVIQVPIVAAVLAWCVAAGFDFTSTPNVERWLKASIQRPAAKAAQAK